MSWAIGITGVPGCGKSAVARAAAAQLAARGERVQVLELDEIRRTLTPAPTYDPAEREAVYRALVAIARTLARAGVPVIIDATAHRRAWRDLARSSISDFAEVQLVCPLDVAQARERSREPGHHPRAIYDRSREPGATVPGVNVPYEAAIAPELTIDTTREPVAEAGARVADLARPLARRTAAPADDVGCAVWVGGRPGSGKTTVVTGVCERLHRRGTWAAVLDPGDFSDAIAGPGDVTAHQYEIAARAVVHCAKMLSDAGLVAIIDAATSVAHLEAVARELVRDFVQVELVCPPEVSRARERAVRWKLVANPPASCPALAPDLGLAYESARHPDLVLYTDVIDEGTSADEVLRLVDRLVRSARERRRPCA